MSNSSAPPNFYLSSYPVHPAHHVPFHHVYRLRKSNMMGRMDRIRR